MDNQNQNTNQSTSMMDNTDNLSQASSQSRSKLSGSLLDRIKAQQQNLQQGGGGSIGQQQRQGQMIVGPDPATPSQITIPNYGPNNQPPMHASNEFSDMGSSSMMTASGFGGATGAFGGASGASPNQNQGGGLMSMSGGGGGAGGGGGGGMSEALLGNSHQQQLRDENYSMSNYFQTFVIDMYNLFRRLPVWAQVILIVFLLFLVIKWIWWSKKKNEGMTTYSIH